MLQPFTCAVVCPPRPPQAPELDPYNDGFSFSRAQAEARRSAEATLELAQAAAEGAGLVVLTEDIHGVRHFWRMLEAPHILRRLAEPVPGPTTKAACRIARRHKTHISLTLYENAGRAVYNTTVLIGPRGRILGAHRKAHLAPGEDWLVEPGDALTLVDTRLGRIGIACGEDYLFTETACVLARRGAEIVLCPSKRPIPELLLLARSFESGFITIFAHPDGSLLIDQRACVLAHSAGRRGFVLTTLFVPQPPAENDRSRLDSVLTGIPDARERHSARRRPELYGVLAERKWPEGSPPTPQRRERVKWEAHGILAAQWQEGPALLPEWEV